MRQKLNEEIFHFHCLIGQYWELCVFLVKNYRTLFALLHDAFRIHFSFSSSHSVSSPLQSSHLQWTPRSTLWSNFNVIKSNRLYLEGFEYLWNERASSVSQSTFWSREPMESLILINCFSSMVALSVKVVINLTSADTSISLLSIKHMHTFIAFHPWLIHFWLTLHSFSIKFLSPIRHFVVVRTREHEHIEIAIKLYNISEKPKKIMINYDDFFLLP